MVLEVGLEPTKPKAGDLQSPVIAATRFQHIPYVKQRHALPYRGAASRTRTVDLLFTKQLL